MRKISVLLVILFFLFCGTIFGAEGDVIWTRTYNGVANGEARGQGIAVDENGSVCVIGYQFVSGESYNIWVRKYDANGYEVWTSTYNGPGNAADMGEGIAVDGDGNVYVTGYEYHSLAEDYNIWIRKFNSNGEEVWTKTYNGASNDADCGYGIAVDGSGNVYVAGYETVPMQWGNIWVRKCDPDGEEIWTRTHNGPINGTDRAHGIAVDESGNVYVTGYENRGEPEDDIWVRKYNSNGEEVWTRTYNGADDQDDEGAGIAVDGMGNVYVVGSEYVSSEWYNIWVRKYDSDGEELWTRTHNGALNTDDWGYAIAVDGSGNVFVTGLEVATAIESDNIWVRKYDADGNVVWTKTYNGSANGSDEGRGIAVDESGNIYVTGFEDVTGEGYNIWVRKYEGPFGANFQPPEEGNVRIQGGEKGYVNPKKGEVAKIHFQPEGSGTVKVRIYTLRGQLVWEGSQSVSGYQDFIEWDCKNDENDVVASGIYVVYVEGPGIKATRKVAILK